MEANTTTTPDEKAETHRFEAEVSQVLRLVINSLYSNKEIFVRELVSNASDALDKLRYRALTDHSLDASVLEVVVTPDRDAKTLTLADTGIGMSKDELVANLGTIARSGSRAFVDALEKNKGDDAAVQLIGQFGVGFYSAFLVADRVEVVSRAAGSTEAWRWVSAADDGFTISPSERASHGTTITLHLKDDATEFLADYTLRSLITRYSDYISHPIKLEVERMVPPVAAEGEELTDDATPTVTKELVQVNKATALWQRPKSELKDEDYHEFYKHLTRDWEPPLAHTHFRVEGTQLFDGLLFVPTRPPFDLYSRDQRHGVRLYVKRVFIMDDCEALLPTYLRFFRGMVDSDDLPLNVSRELLQDSATVRFIKKQVTKKSLDLLDRLAEAEDQAAYTTLWETYGTVLKEGFNVEPQQKTRLAKLLRVKTSSSSGGWVSLDTVKERMPDGQQSFYYVIADSVAAAERSPHLEALRAKGYEVIYLTDPIDEWAVGALQTYADLGFESAMGANLSVDDDVADDADKDDDTTSKDDDDAGFTALAELMKTTLGERVGDVKRSTRLRESPMCLVIPDGGVHAHMERLLAVSQPGYVAQKRIVELNAGHALVKDLSALAAAGPEADSAEHAQLVGWIELLYGQAVLTEGSKVDDPAVMAEQITALLSAAARRAVK